ncbi:late expression factor 1 [Erinnyis ello granulovirus]|uniref:Late expression factor 1 n=1 Tax=Erinnyis ello granulovirus TaxID=307444 RepID=A0A097DAN7_9BBAC|nr:late expression factor 1 [Erinnyis ello granulovirus]AIS92065.1 late expression factor 1 [Erinnyis ello granulovirus]ARX71405.1 late expression factor 1 [Erinnyis ello granulovirus]ARX71535.1 late expression factor 1 [Erinnyis ello granulovirus]ARX71665.1 late expression factor 1 [Erinnyis ello granulovirus]ARX71795.1 late expression factor 1 [Erinnyis ello granulovirus]
MQYTNEQLLRVWTSVAFKEDRYWAFVKTNGTWLHSDSQHSKHKTFQTFDEFCAYCKHNDVKDIHVKRLVDDSREWVIDVDHNETNYEKIKLKNMITHCMFQKFFAGNCAKIVYSGNRGLHIWLDRKDFDIKASKVVKTYYYDSMLTTPKTIVAPFVQPDSLHECFLKTFDNMWIRRNIHKLYPHINLDNTTTLVKEFYPYVDKQVFVSNKQIRAPYSFNTKGNKFSCDHELVVE